MQNENNTCKPNTEMKPDILIPYTIKGEALLNSRMAIAYVRPETNKVHYEAVILKSASPFANVVYMANINGRVINNCAIIACHYSSQLHFAINGKEEFEKFPEMIQKFEEKFKVNFNTAPIIGPFEAIIEYKLKANAEELFASTVPAEDFIDMYGQTIKKLGDYYVINYDIPAVITRHNAETDMFVIALRFKENSAPYQDLNYAVYQNMLKRETTTFIASDIRGDLPWHEQVRRTYHISRSHMESMFDLTDYVFRDATHRIHYLDTPLGQTLLHRGIVAETELEKRLMHLKENPLVYLNREDGSTELVNIIAQGRQKKDGVFVERSLEECCQLIESINWEKTPEL